VVESFADSGTLIRNHHIKVIVANFASCSCCLSLLILFLLELFVLLSAVKSLLFHFLYIF
jgi:hypothetical protein